MKKNVKQTVSQSKRGTSHSYGQTTVYTSFLQETWRLC